MSDKVQGKAIEHSMSQCKGQGRHIIAVGYKPVGGGLNEVTCTIPLYDIRDMDLSGGVSWSEAGWSAATRIIDPLYIFGIMNSLGRASFHLEAAHQLRDYQMMMATTREILEQTFKLRHEILRAVLVKSFVTANINLNVDLFNLGLTEISKLGFLTTFVVKTVLEQAVMRSIQPMLN